MANLEIEGRISRKLAAQSGQSARGPWKKQDFIVEYQDGNYPSQTLFTAFGDNLVADLDRYAVGDMVRVSFNVRAREYNGRWYNDVRAWRISPAGQQAPAQPRQASTAPASYAEPQQGFTAPAPSVADMPADMESDDLPF